jgi:hypothetical protein
MSITRFHTLYGGRCGSGQCQLTTCGQIHPGTLDATTRSDWCSEQSPTCPLLYCSESTSQNSCDPVGISRDGVAAADYPGYVDIRMHLRLWIDAEPNRLYPNSTVGHVLRMEVAKCQRESERSDVAKHLSRRDLRDENCLCSRIRNAHQQHIVPRRLKASVNRLRMAHPRLVSKSGRGTELPVILAIAPGVWFLSLVSVTAWAIAFVTMCLRRRRKARNRAR